MPFWKRVPTETEEYSSAYVWETLWVLTHFTQHDGLDLFHHSSNTNCLPSSEDAGATVKDCCWPVKLSSAGISDGDRLQWSCNYREQLVAAFEWQEKRRWFGLYQCLVFFFSLSQNKFLSLYFFIFQKKTFVVHTRYRMKLESIPAPPCE